MRRLCLLLTCIAATPAAWADDVGRGRTSARYEVASADARDLTAAVRVALWPSSAQGQASPPPAAPAQAHAAPYVPETTPGAGLKGACDTRIDGGSLRALVWREAQTIGVDPKLGLTILSLESNDGVSLNSDKGARGPMRLIPETAARYGVTDICDPEQNIRGGLLFLKDLVDQFQGNMMLVAAAYNAGPERVYTAGGVPAITETVRYVASAANKYYGLSVFAARRKRGYAAPSTPAGTTVAQASEDGSTGERPRQEWIGDSVLYVGDGETR
jgi:soluble lytic murein transglycosylase-like protein